MPKPVEFKRVDGWTTVNGKRWWRLEPRDTGRSALRKVEGKPPFMEPVFRDGLQVREGDDEPRFLLRARAAERELPHWIWSEWEAEIKDASRNTLVDKRTIIACICTESAGKYNAERYEPHLRDRSMGLMQTLTRTARHVGTALGYPTQVPLDDAKAVTYLMPKNSLPEAVNDQAVNEWRRFLYEPRNSILIGAKTLAILDERYKLGGDPVLLAASYNAGGPYADNANSWGLRMHGPHVDAYAGFWTLAAEVVA